jgi:protein arginine kinase activator
MIIDIMLCDKCKQREAVVKFTQIIGNEKSVINLCKSCVEEQGLNNPLVDISKVFGKLIIGIISEHLTSKLVQTPKDDKGPVCNNCGLSWFEFQSLGRLGCSHCYEAFAKNMKFLLRRLHGCNRHVGAKYKNVYEGGRESIENLRKRLQKAVKEEKYELAAELRDTIREYKNKKK